MNINLIEQQVRSLHEQGYSIRAIASYLGIDKSKIQRILKKLQESGDMEDDTAIDTPDRTGDTARDARPDTGDTPLGKARDTGDSVPVSLFDTRINTVSNPKVGENGGPVQPLAAQKSYTLAEVQRLLAQVWLFKQDYSEYVAKMVSLHMGKVYIETERYQGYARKAQRLTQSAGFILDQLQQDPKGLLATQVLQSIHATIEAVLTGKDKVSTSCGQYNLTDRVRALKFWQDSLAADFLEPKR